MFSFYFQIGSLNFLIIFNNRKIFKKFRSFYLDFISSSTPENFTTINLTYVKKFDPSIIIFDKNIINIQIVKDINKSFHDTILEANWRVKTAIANQIINKKILLLHASCIVLEESIYAFSGVSGAGKSTASKISENNGYLKPCDDSVLIDASKNNIIVYSTPFIEKEKTYYKKNSWPLNSIYFLNQSEKDQKKILNKIVSVKKILNNSYLSENNGNNQNMISKSFDIAENITNKISCYDLYFTKSNKFIDTITNDK